MLAIHPPPSWPHVLSTENEADAMARARRAPGYIAPARSFGVNQLGAVWPHTQTMAAEFDLANRLNRLPFYAPAGFGAAIQQPASWPRAWTTEGEMDLQSRLHRLPFYNEPIQAVRVVPGFGGVMEDIQSILSKAPELLQKGVQIINKAGPHLDTVMAVVQDPALPGLIERIKTLQALQAAKPKTAAAPGAPAPSPSTDTGIKNLFPLLDAAIVVEKNPALKFATAHPVLVGAGALLILTGIGFGIGRLTKRCHVPSPSVAGRTYRRRRD